MIKRLAPLFSLCLALGCGSPTAAVERFDLGQPFWITVGETKLSVDGGTVVTFVRVVTDSRCPVNAVCVWAGEAIIEVNVFTPPDPTYEPAVAALRNDGSARAAPKPKEAELSFAPPAYEVKIGASEPLVADGRRIEALWLDAHGAGAGPASARRARLRVDTIP